MELSSTARPLKDQLQSTNVTTTTIGLVEDPGSVKVMECGQAIDQLADVSLKFNEM